MTPGEGQDERKMMQMDIYVLWKQIWKLMYMENPKVLDYCRAVTVYMKIFMLSQCQEHLTRTITRMMSIILRAQHISIR